jgi:glycosyltransferase involved in cell wall biosynthesis
LSHQENQSLLDQCDILLSPHRSEGFGLHLAEAMARGKCVIATGWSGNLQFMSYECAALLPYTLVPLHDPAGVYPQMRGAFWAEPDLKAGAGALAELAADADKRRRMGAAAKAAIAERLGTSRYRQALGR